MDKKQIQELASGSTILWEKTPEARENNPVFKSRTMLMRAFELALTELEMCWARESLGERATRGSIKIVMQDENGREVFCKPSFSTGYLAGKG
jgi:hypothetical protein